MTQAYTPGLLVTPFTRWRCRRLLPVSGEVLVQQGQHLGAQEIVAQTESPGDAFPINLARQLGISSSQVPSALVPKLGVRVNEGELLARTAGWWGFLAKELPSPISGTLEAASAITGLVILRGAPRRIELRAYLAGEVVDVIPHEGVVMEADAAVIQGIFGIGGETYGRLTTVVRAPDEDLTPDRLEASHQGAIVIGGRRITREAVDRARALGVSALVAGGIDDADLKAILGYDLGVAVTGMERLGISIIITEGFGDIAMARRTFDLLSGLSGSLAAVNGTTQIRAGVLRPEIIVPVNRATTTGAPAVSGILQVGASVRVIREPYFGSLGRVESLPPEPQVLASQSRARVVVVRLSNGEQAIVPRANVELMEGATA